MGKSPVGPVVVVDSEFEVVSVGLESSDSFNVVASTAQSAEIPRFRGFSQNSKSCGVPARLKTSELSVHQISKNLHAESPSNASSASRLGGSTLDPWVQASTESYISMVDGGLLPGGHEDSFVKLAQAARPAQKRIKKRIAAMSPMDLGAGRRSAEEVRLQEEEARKSASEQLMHASGRVPKKARTRLAMMSFSGPTARQDAERAEKSRWLGHLATLLARTETPLGQRLAQKPGASNTMGLGLRSGTLRNRVHVLRRFLSWLATSHQVPFPTSEEHILDYLEIKVQEPCTRSALKAVHQSLVYLEEISEISPAARLTVKPRYSNLFAELLSQTRPGAEPKQAPRPLLRVLEAIERTVVDHNEAVFIRLYAWFYLLQTWCSLRFDDHRGLEPGLLRNTEHSLTGVLTRSKTHGPDKKIQRNPIFLDKSCWIAVKDWCDVGFNLLLVLAPYERDYLLPSPGRNHAGIREAEMSYDAGLGNHDAPPHGALAEGQRWTQLSPSTGPRSLL